MKRAYNLIEQLKNLPYFDKQAVYRLGESAGLTSKTVDTYISRYLKRKDIFQLKKGLYVSSDFYAKNVNDISYTFYLANILRSPSYISSWSALQYYDLATEAVRTVTSVTTKGTRSRETKAGSFSHQTIKKDLFCDFYLVHGKFDFYIASREKALFDMLYFKTRQFRDVPFEKIDSLVRELRIDMNEMNAEEKDKFYSLLKKQYDHE
jgi:predicted transcriptional regulator of viral defense system